MPDVFASNSALTHSELCQSRSPLTLMVAVRGTKLGVGEGLADGWLGEGVAVREADEDVAGALLELIVGDAVPGAHPLNRRAAPSTVKALRLWITMARYCWQGVGASNRVREQARCSRERSVSEFVKGPSDYAAILICGKRSPSGVRC